MLVALMRIFGFVSLQAYILYVDGLMDELPSSGAVRIQFAFLCANIVYNVAENF
jgi:hypothetical protein